MTVSLCGFNKGSFLDKYHVTSVDVLKYYLQYISSLRGFAGEGRDWLNEVLTYF